MNVDFLVSGRDHLELGKVNVSTVNRFTGKKGVFLEIRFGDRMEFVSMSEEMLNFFRTWKPEDLK